MKILFLDLDGVMVDLNSSSNNKWGASDFIPKCVNTLNQIIRETNCDIVLSSAWKNDYTLVEISEIFKWNGVIKSPIGFTPRLKSDVLNLSKSRADEISSWLNLHDWKNQIKWVAVDDLNLDEYLFPNFVHCPVFDNGLSHSDIKDIIIKKLN